LIKLEQFAEAQAVFDQAKSKGAKGEGFDKLEQRLKASDQDPLEAGKTAIETSPQQPNILDSLKLDQAISLAKKKAKKGDPGEAKRIYQDILIKFPKNKRASDGIKELAGGAVGEAFKVQDPPQDQQQSLINLHIQGQHQQALEQAKTLVQQFPRSSVLFNIQGAALKSLGQLDQSIEAYKRALAIEPDYANAHYNMGVTLQEQGKLEEAIKAYDKALAIKPDYAQAYFNMGNVFKNQGKLEEAIEAYNKAQAIKPDYAEAYNNMGVALKDQGKPEEAIEIYKKILSIKPDNAEAYNNMGIALQEKGKLEEAIEAYTKALSVKPDYAEAYINMGNTFRGQGTPEEAIKAFKKALSIKPDHPDAYNNMGNSLIDQGKPEEAIEAFKKTILIKPDHAEAHRHISSVTKYTLSNPQIKNIEALLQQSHLSDSDRCQLLYTQAKIQEDLGNLGAALDSYVSGGKLRQKLLDYEFAQDQHLFDQIKAKAPQFSDIFAKVTYDAATHVPIFILGMPRSGTSLVEQILSSHSQVTGAGELGYAAQFGGDLAVGRCSSDAEAVLTFRKQYLTELAKRADGRKLVTDKMPHNFRFIALICAAFPEAKIIHVKRNPAATCWSNFRNYFSSNALGYSYNLVDTVEYYRLYTDLMKFWYQIYQDRIYDLDYDKLTEFQELETQRLIKHLGLPWENMCLFPQHNKRSVSTASKQQIRKKVYKGSSQAWRLYEPFLNDVFERLHV